MPVAAIYTHTCFFPIEHRGNGEAVSFACPTCKKPAWKEMEILRDENEALRVKIARLETKKG